MVAARMAVPFLQEVELGKRPKLPKSIKRQSLNEMAAFVVGSRTERAAECRKPGLAAEPCASFIWRFLSSLHCWRMGCAAWRIAAGSPGFYAMLEAVADPNHPNHAETKEWLDEYDPKVIDELPIKYALAASRTGVMLPRPASLTTSKPHQPLSSRNQPPRPSPDGYEFAASCRLERGLIDLVFEGHQRGSKRRGAANSSWRGASV